MKPSKYYVIGDENDGVIYGSVVGGMMFLVIVIVIAVIGIKKMRTSSPEKNDQENTGKGWQYQGKNCYPCN